MTQSSFYSDGYRDGELGLQASPPDPYTFHGHTTNVYAAEYLDGWMEGRAGKPCTKLNPKEESK